MEYRSDLSSMYNLATNSEDTSTAIGRTFAVSKVSPTTTPLREVPYYEAVAEFLGRPIEACSRYRGQLVESVDFYHPLIGALHTAFAFHHPICLSPDASYFFGKLLAVPIPSQT